MAARIALLTCHEMGHVLGLDHNFVASTYGRGSVMDYFAPRVRLRPDGSADLSDAYMQDVGSYDRFAIQWGYSQPKDGTSAEEDHARLDAIVKTAISKGVVWGNYYDPRWNAYDDGYDPVSWLSEVQGIRDTLLLHFGPQMLRTGEPNSMLATRFPLIYLFHRYALAAALNVVGSAKVPLSLAGDGQTPVIVWPPEEQGRALRLLLQALDPAKLAVPEKLWSALAPVENRDPDAERFTSTAGYLFSPEDGARAVAEIVVAGLLDPTRMQRLHVLSGQDANALSPATIISELITAGFTGQSGAVRSRNLAGVVQTQIAERLMVLAANSDATPEIRAAALTGVHKVQDSLRRVQASNPAFQHIDHEITLFLQNPEQNTPKIKPSGAPPGPPV